MSATRHQFRPQLESFEERSLMASGITASFSQGVLSIMGTSACDRIIVNEAAGQVRVDGFSGSIRSTMIKSISIDARGGDDAITVSLTPAMAMKTSVYGGDGIDSLVAPGAALPRNYHGLAADYSGIERYLNSGKNVAHRRAIDQSFGNIKGEFEVLAPASKTYNCIAWSLGITNRWVWPSNANRISTWDSLNGSYGYQRLSTLDFSRVRGYEKIVLYGKVDANGNVTEFTHQARQLKDGTWTSKCGQLGLIRHVTPDTLDGNSYGVPVAVYYRYNANFA